MLNLDIYFDLLGRYEMVLDSETEFVNMEIVPFNWVNHVWAG